MDSNIENSPEEEDKSFNASELLAKLAKHNQELDQFNRRGSVFKKLDSYSNENKSIYLNELLGLLEEEKDALEGDAGALQELRNGFEKDFEITRNNAFHLILSDIIPVLTEYISTIKRVDNAIVRIKEQLEIINKNDKSINTQKPNLKIQWKAGQKELAELFVELQKKGWIEVFDNDIPKYAETIKSAFAFKGEALTQYLKPCQDKKTYERPYTELYKDNYKPKFNEIQQNIKPK